MNYSVKTIQIFEKQAKKLIKKHPSLKNEIFKLIQELKTNAKSGTPIGKSCYKIRLAIRSKGKGKFGGSRVITHVLITDKMVYLLSIYDKSTKATITDKELANLLASIS